MCEALSGIGLETEGTSCFSHSTSWRYEPGQTVLTYIVWVRPEDLPPLATRVLEIDKVATPDSAGPMSPRPSEIRQEHVLFHGLRHIRFLMNDRSAGAFTQGVSPEENFDLFRNLRPAPAGRIH